MIKVIAVLFTLILTSFFFFPFEPVFLPGITVKTILAGLSLPYIAFLLAKGRNAIVSHDVVTIILFTLPITLFSWCPISTIIRMIILLISILYRFLCGWEQLV